MAMVGALAGIVPTALALTLLPIQYLRLGPMGALHVSPIALVGSLSIALLVGLIAGAFPAYQALKLRTVDALRKVA